MSKHWIYGRPAFGEVAETALRAGPEYLAQAGHFHDEVQIVAVREGWRSYATPAGVFRGEAGQIVVLPARLFHSPMMCDARSTVANIYLPVEHSAVSHIACPFVLDGHRASEFDEVIDRVATARVVFASDEGMRRASDWAARVIGASSRIQDLANSAGLSADGFIRSFAKHVGTTPVQYRIAHRLNAARAMLRQGDAPASVASECGFADQSHLGRCFLRAYGATPAAYRAGMQPK